MGSLIDMHGAESTARRTARVRTLERMSDPLSPTAALKFCPRNGQNEAHGSVVQWMQGGWRGLYLYGPPGVGKTLLAERATVLLRARSVPVLFVTVKRALDGLRNLESVDLWRDKLAGADVLVLDDLGAHTVTDFALAELTDAIGTRYRDGKPTLVTSNLAARELRDTFDARFVSRLAGLCHAVAVTGRDHRLEAAP